MRRGNALLVCLCGLAAVTAVGCGGGERQDENEADASYDVTVVDATFPKRQRLAQKSELAITVRNDDTEAIPDLAVTLNGIYRRLDDPKLADPNRPVFMIAGVEKQIGGYPEVKLAGPGGGPTSQAGTWVAGKLGPNAERTLRWRFTAVRPGPFEVTYEVAAGLDGKAKAVLADDSPPRGKLVGTISSAAPNSRIAADGRTVVTPLP
ncbi:MAG TPA: hypothetical protein VEX36_09835 [Thermoleophilaceae bacterium]|nr:hypothetical protein [Thermoleophilaceae bacterium]